MEAADDNTLLHSSHPLANPRSLWYECLPIFVFYLRSTHNCKSTILSILCVCGLSLDGYFVSGLLQHVWKCHAYLSHHEQFTITSPANRMIIYNITSPANLMFENTILIYYYHITSNLLSHHQQTACLFIISHHQQTFVSPETPHQLIMFHLKHLWMPANV